MSDDEQTPFYRTATLDRPENIEKWPKVSLFCMAKNAESCIGRLLENVGPYLHDVVLILNDTTDGTRTIAEAWGKKSGKEVQILEVTAESHPDLYIFDTAETYQKGRSLCDETFNGPFMEAPILANWSAARNLGWGLCKGDWKLFLDADDVVLDPESLPGLCLKLDEVGVSLACTKYFYNVDDVGRAKGGGYRERLAKASVDIRWVYPIHEVLYGSTRTSHIDGNLAVIDKRDNQGQGIRIPGRNFKILYQAARDADWDVSPRTLVNLIMEVRHFQGQAMMMEFAQKLLELYLLRSTWPEERGWALALVGEMHEKEDRHERAIEMYRESLKEHPGSKTAFRLCRALHHFGAWDESIEAYAEGMANQAVHQVLDDGPLFVEMSKILVSDCHRELGDKAEALKFAKEAMEAFPSNVALQALVRQIEAMP